VIAMSAPFPNRIVSLSETKIETENVNVIVKLEFRIASTVERAT
jgi:hypothetical protein